MTWLFISLRRFALLLTLALTVAGGTVFFHAVEGWGWLDSYFFTVVTLSTVGYGSLVPVTSLGKVGATLLIFIGLGVFAAAVQQFGSYTVKKREEHTERILGMLAQHRHDPARAGQDKP